MKSLFSKSHTSTVKPPMAMPRPTAFGAISTILTFSLLTVGITYASHNSSAPTAATNKGPSATLITVPPVAATVVSPTDDATNITAGTTASNSTTGSSVETSTSTNEVTVNGQSIIPPSDGSTLTKEITTPDGSSTTVVSVTGDHQSVTSNTGSTTTTNRMSVRTMSDNHSRLTATDNSP